MLTTHLSVLFILALSLVFPGDVPASTCIGELLTIRHGLSRIFVIIILLLLHIRILKIMYACNKCNCE